MNKKRLSILLYHRVLSEYDPLRPSEPDICWFDRQMRWVKRFYNVLDLADAVNKLRKNQLPPRALCITFDDGYRDNYQNALPVLEKYGLTATFFVATGFLNNGIMWNDTVIESLRETSVNQLDLNDYGLGHFKIGTDRAEVIKKILNKLKYLSLNERSRVVEDIPSMLAVPKPGGLMMTNEQVDTLYKKGMGIGGHTVNHPILSKIDIQSARQEIEDGKKALERIINNPVALFAYPNGKPGQDYQQEHVDVMADMGFEAAVSTAWGAASTRSDLYQLPRFTPWDKNIPKYLLRLGIMRHSRLEEKL